MVLQFMSQTKGIQWLPVKLFEDTVRIYWSTVSPEIQENIPKLLALKPIICVTRSRNRMYRMILSRWIDPQPVPMIHPIFIWRRNQLQLVITLLTGQKLRSEPTQPENCVQIAVWLFKNWNYDGNDNL